MLPPTMAPRTVSDLWQCCWMAPRHVLWDGGERAAVSYPRDPGGSAHALSHHHSTKQQQPSARQRNVCALL